MLTTTRCVHVIERDSEKDTELGNKNLTLSQKGYFSVASSEINRRVANFAFLPNIDNSSLRLNVGACSESAGNNRNQLNLASYLHRIGC